MPKRMHISQRNTKNLRTLARAIGGRVRARRVALELTQEHTRARMELEQVFISPDPVQPDRERRHPAGRGPS